jgi:hypothetical protein
MNDISKLKNIFILFALVVFSSCQSTNDLPLELSNKVEIALNKSGENRIELNKSLSTYEGEKKEAVAFLIAYMPDRDLQELSSDFIISNVELAYKVKSEFTWTQNLDKETFFNEVLPYVSLNETRELWRKDFYNRFKKYVENSKTIEEAIWAVNNNIQSEIGVEYNTKREKPDQSPFESMKQGMASCSGLSILLVDAFRSVGIPSRVAGTPDWYNNSGNHNWVEVYVNGKWHFTEYYPSGKFDESWFLERAGKADKNNKSQWMYASSYKPTGLSFPLVWDDSIKYVYAENVTDRYINLYEAEVLAKKKLEGKIMVQIVMLKGKDCSISGNNRVKTEIHILENNSVSESGFTSGSIDDMNNYLDFQLEENKNYYFKYNNESGMPILKKIKTGEDDMQVVLYFNEEPKA